MAVARNGNERASLFVPFDETRSRMSGSARSPARPRKMARARMNERDVHGIFFCLCAESVLDGVGNT